jgi:hypothetical protein
MAKGGMNRKEFQPGAPKKLVKDVQLELFSRQHLVMERKRNIVVRVNKIRDI